MCKSVVISVCTYNIIYTALQKANDEYSKKVESGSAKEKTLLNLAWKVDDLSRLNQSGRQLLVDVTTKVEMIDDESTDIVTTTSLCS